MTFYKKRERFTRFSIKVGMLFSKFGLTPNQWTLLSIVPVFISLYFLIMGDFLLAAILFIISSFMDLIDGSVARVMGKVTKKGAYLDTIIDRYVEAIIIFGLLFVAFPVTIYISSQFWLFLYFFGAMMTTYSKAAAKEKGLTEKEIKGGLLERAERLIILFIGILLAIFDRSYLLYIIIFLALLTNITALQRMWIALKGKRE